VLCSIENSTFLVGEEITYKLFYNWNILWLSAGEVVFRVEESEDQYHIVVTGRTYKSYEWFFKVNDRFETYIDKKSLLPTLFIRDIKEGKYRRYNKFIFDQKNNKVRFFKGKTSEDLVETELDLDPCMHDLVSILYHIRNRKFDDFEVGDVFPVSVFLEEEYNLKVKVTGKNEKKRVKGRGLHMTHQFIPEVIAGEVFNEKDQMKVWVSADENKIPLLIESPVSVGKIKAVLKEYKGLKYDMNSRIRR
jgi:hypothetical protein